MDDEGTIRLGENVKIHKKYFYMMIAVVIIAIPILIREYTAVSPPVNSAKAPAAISDAWKPSPLEPAGDSGDPSIQPSRNEGASQPTEAASISVTRDVGVKVGREALKSSSIQAEAEVAVAPNVNEESTVFQNEMVMKQEQIKIALTDTDNIEVELAEMEKELKQLEFEVEEAKRDFDSGLMEEAAYLEKQRLFEEKKVHYQASESMLNRKFNDIFEYEQRIRELKATVN